MQFKVEIKASKKRVWDTLFEDKTFQDWASIIDEGTYRLGELIEGQEVQFISSASGYGVTSLVSKIIPNEFILFRQMADTKDNGTQEREKQWTGSEESYSLSETNGITTLTIEIDVPSELQEIFQDRYPKALERIKTLAEEGSNTWSG